MVAKTSRKAAKFSLGEDVEIKGNSPYDSGLGHMLNILSGHYMDNAKTVYDSLMEQITKASKKKTWREGKDEEFKDVPKL